MELFEQRLRSIIANEEVREVLPSAHGTKYTVTGMMAGAAGGEAMIRTVWIIEALDAVPRLVTAYPDE